MNSLDILEMEVDKDECWEWEGSYMVNVPAVWYQGKKVSACRVAYSMHVRKVKPGEHVWRTCRNHRCINYLHLLAGSSEDHGKWVEEKSVSLRRRNEGPVDVRRYYENLRRAQGLDSDEKVRYYGRKMTFQEFEKVWRSQFGRREK